MRDLDDAEAAAYGAIMVSRGVGAATARRRVMSLKSLIRFGREVGYLEARPTPHRGLVQTY